jgi:hypothetical protein
MTPSIQPPAQGRKHADLGKPCPPRLAHEAPGFARQEPLPFLPARAPNPSVPAFAIEAAPWASTAP